MNTLPLSQDDKDLLLDFVEHDLTYSVFMIAEKYGYFSAADRHDALYLIENIRHFTTTRLMIAMIMLMDNGEEF